MADSTSASESLSREECADELEAIASELRGGEAEIGVAVGNKSVSLSPAETVEYAIEIRERSPMLRGKRESVSIDLKWKATN